VERPARLALLTAAAAAFGVAVWLDFPLCPLAAGLGIPCPGCGLTRATLALLVGDVPGALRLHPLVWLLTPLFVGFVGLSLWELVRDPRKPLPKPRIQWNGRGVGAVALALLLLSCGVWLARFAGYFGGPVPVTTMRAWLVR
jgi:hypothetical protein